MGESKYMSAPWAISPHPWPEQVGCCPLVGRPYSVHGTDNRNVAAATTKDIARLIAAAPEMLAFAKRVMADHRAKLPSEARDLYGGGCGCPQCEQAAAAIQKAEGK